MYNIVQLWLRSSIVLMDIYVNEAHFIRHSTDKSDSAWFINDEMILKLITVKMIGPNWLCCGHLYNIILM